MENLVTHLITPPRLILAWQAPEGRSADRYRYAVGEVVRTGTTAALRYFDEDAFQRRNISRTLASIVSLGYEGYPGFDRKSAYHPEGVMAALKRRVPPQSRSDFQEYRKQFRLADDLKLSDFDLLALTEAKLPSDGFSLVDPFDCDVDDQWRDIMFEIAGYRHWGAKRSKSLIVGTTLELSPEPDNAYDAGAVRFMVGEDCIGYVNRLQAPAFMRWSKEFFIAAQIERLNGSAEKPRAFAFVRVRPSKAARAA